MQILCDQTPLVLASHVWAFVFTASHLMYVHWSIVNKFKLSLNLWMMHLLTCRSFNLTRASNKCLARFDVLPPVVSSFCMKSNAIFHFNYSLYLFVSGALIEFHLFDPLRSSVVRFTSYHLQVHFRTAAYEIPKWAKLWYRTVWNIIDTGIFPVPVYHASLKDI